MEGMVRDCFKQHLATGRVIASHFTAKSKAAMNISMTLDFYVFSFSSTRPKFLCSGKMSAKALVSDVFFFVLHMFPLSSFWFLWETTPLFPGSWGAACSPLSGTVGSNHMTKLANQSSPSCWPR